MRFLIDALEDDGNFTRQHEAVLTLLDAGPLRCEAAVAQERGNAEPDYYIGLELLAFLRSLVRHEGGLAYGRLGIGPLTFGASLLRGRVHGTVDGSFRDVTKQQLLTALLEVGLVNVRQCGAPDCGRLYVKTYRREFCSRACQKRSQAQRLRLADRLARGVGGARDSRPAPVPPFTYVSPSAKTAWDAAVRTLRADQQQTPARRRQKKGTA